MTVNCNCMKNYGKKGDLVECNGGREDFSFFGFLCAMKLYVGIALAVCAIYSGVIVKGGKGIDVSATAL